MGKVTYFHVRMRSQVPRRLPGTQPQVARAKVTYVEGHFHETAAISGSAYWFHSGPVAVL